MEKDKRPERSEDTRSPREIKNALERTPDKDLLDEVFRRGLIMRADLKRDTSDIDEEIARIRTSAARRREYVGQLIDLLSRKRLDKIRERGIQRTDATPVITRLGMITIRAIFDHLVIARRAELDVGSCDIESLREYLMYDSGYNFASSLIKGDIHMHPNLLASFVYQIIQESAISFLHVGEEDATDRSSTESILSDSF